MFATGFDWWLPIDASSHGVGIDRLITFIHWFMAVLFVGWGIFFVYCLIAFRSRSGHQASATLPKAKASKVSEVGVIIIEAILLLGFSIPLWAKSKGASHVPTEDDRFEVRVVAQQFAWNIHYPGRDGKFGETKFELVSSDNPVGLDRSSPNAKDDIVTNNQMHIPVNKDILVHLTSKDVIHSFALPLLRVKQDAIPGISVPVWFRATRTTDEIRELMRKSYPVHEDSFLYLKNHLAVDTYKDSDGNTVVEKNAPIFEDTVTALLEAGITEVEAYPAVPTEIACAQLCGLTHYRMRGYLHIDTEEQFEAWLAEEESYLEEDDEEDY